RSRRTALRCTHRPQNIHPFHRGRGGRRPLRGFRALGLYPARVRLARRRVRRLNRAKSAPTTLSNSRLLPEYTSPVLADWGQLCCAALTWSLSEAKRTLTGVSPRLSLSRLTRSGHERVAFAAMHGPDLL